MSFEVEESNYYHFQISTFDFQQATPSSFDHTRNLNQGSKFKNVPVLRIFTSSPKALILVHNVYPYFFIPFNESLDHCKLIIRCSLQL